MSDDETLFSISEVHLDSGLRGIPVGTCKTSYVDPIDGVVLVDPEYLKDRKVYGHVLAAFRYGREDLDVLGMSFNNF